MMTARDNDALIADLGGERLVDWRWFTLTRFRTTADGFVVSRALGVATPWIGFFVIRFFTGEWLWKVVTK